MQTEYIEKWQNMGKDTYDAIKELEILSMKTAEQITSQNMELMNAYVEAGVKQMSLLQETRNYQDLMSNQVALASEVTSKMVANARKTADILADARTEFTSWMETKLDQAVPKAATPAKKAPARKAA